MAHGHPVPQANIEFDVESEEAVAAAAAELTAPVPAARRPKKSRGTDGGPLIGPECFSSASRTHPGCTRVTMFDRPGVARERVSPRSVQERLVALRALRFEVDVVTRYH